MSLNNAQIIYRESTSNTNTSTYKFKLDYQTSIINNRDTREWIQLMEKIDHDSGDVLLFKSLLLKKTPVIVKVGTPSILDHEYQVAKKLHIANMPIFSTPI